MKKINNKGFSLVELIIVIAIMAILVGIVGTQVLPYIDKAKEAKDIQIVSTDATTAFVGCTDQLDSTKTYTITATKGASGWTVDAKDDTGASSTVLRNAFVEMNEITTKAPNLQSKEGKKITKITIVCKHGNFAAKLTVDGPQNPSAFKAETK